MRWPEDPDAQDLKETDDGILVRGWKAIGTSVPFANYLLIGNLWRPGQTPEQTIYALVPIATTGISIVARQSNAKPDADPYDRPLLPSVTSSTPWPILTMYFCLGHKSNISATRTMQMVPAASV